MKEFITRLILKFVGKDLKNLLEIVKEKDDWTNKRIDSLDKKITKLVKLHEDLYKELKKEIEKSEGIRKSGDESLWNRIIQLENTKYLPETILKEITEVVRNHHHDSRYVQK